MFRKIVFIICCCWLTPTVVEAQKASAPNGYVLEESPEIKRMMDEFIQYNQSNRTLKGFRVQIYNGTKAKAQQHKSQCLRQLEEYKVYMVYEYPEYRVHLGDFRDELEAERALMIIRQTFPGAFTVSTMINWPEI